jgi:hypothetical protein
MKFFWIIAEYTGVTGKKNDSYCTFVTSDLEIEALLQSERVKELYELTENEYNRICDSRGAVLENPYFHQWKDVVHQVLLSKTNLKK